MNDKRIPLKNTMKRFVSNLECILHFSLVQIFSLNFKDISLELVQP